MDVTRLDLVISRALKLNPRFKQESFSLSASTNGSYRHSNYVKGLRIHRGQFNHDFSQESGSLYHSQEKLEYDSKSFEEDLIHQTRFIYHGIPAEIPQNLD